MTASCGPGELKDHERHLCEPVFVGGSASMAVRPSSKTVRHHRALHPEGRGPAPPDPFCKGREQRRFTAPTGDRRGGPGRHVCLCFPPQPSPC